MSQSGFSIRNYHDTTAIYHQLADLLAQPVVPLKRAALDQYLSWFETECPKSKQMINTAREIIPGGVQHNLSFNYPFPLVFTRAEGAYLQDIDGHRYIDFLQAGGPTVLGSNYPTVRDRVIDLLETCGPSTGLFHEYEYKLADFICSRVPGVEMYRSLGSGTEGVMAAIRVARVATGKKKVIKVGGAYHGWSDQLAYALNIPRTGRFQSHGIPRQIFTHTQEVFPNDLNALERKLRLNQVRGGTAAVIVEPLGPESGTRPVPFDYNKNVRALCDKYGALLIFDEVVTAFRVGISGAQGYFNVIPDLTVFGKVVSGGYPAAGGLGGRRDIMSYLVAGVEGTKKRAKVGGTLSANPLSCAAGYYTLIEIEKTDACAKAGAAGDRLTAGLQQIIAKHNLPYVAYNQGSIVHLETSGVMLMNLGLNIMKALKEIKERKKMMEEMGAAYLAEGIVTIAGSRLYTSLADSDDIIDDALERFDRVFGQIEIE